MTPLQESLKVLSAMKNIISNDLTVIKRYIHDEDLKFSLSNKMLADLVSFLDEWDILRGIARGDKAILETAELAQPAIARIRKWHGLRAMRNTMISHNFRDKRNKNQPTCLQKNYFDATVPRTYAEIMLLSEYAVYAASTVICRHYKDQAQQIENTPTYRENPCTGISTYEEFEKEVESLKQTLFAKDSSLKACFGV